LSAADDVKREQYRENARAHHHRVVAECDVRHQEQRQAEPAEVRPVLIDQVQAHFQFHAHVAPLVFERVERVQQTHVNAVQQAADAFQRDKPDRVGLLQEDELEGGSIKQIGDADTERAEGTWPAVEQLVNAVRDIQEPDAAHGFADQVQRHDPERGENIMQESFDGRPETGMPPLLAAEDLRCEQLKTIETINALMKNFAARQTPRIALSVWAQTRGFPRIFRTNSHFVL